MPGDRAGLPVPRIRLELRGTGAVDGGQKAVAEFDFRIGPAAAEARNGGDQRMRTGFECQFIRIDIGVFDIAEFGTGRELFAVEPEPVDGVGADAEHEFFRGGESETVPVGDRPRRFRLPGQRDPLRRPDAGIDPAADRLPPPERKTADRHAPEIRHIENPPVGSGQPAGTALFSCIPVKYIFPRRYSR